VEETRIINPVETYEGLLPGLEAGTELHGGKFLIEHQIGNGGFGITYLAKDTYLERDVVIKECFPEAFCFRFGARVQVSSPRLEAQYRHSVEMFMREARSIAKLRHPNIVSVHQVFEENGTAYMVLDMIDGRDLADIIEDEEDVLSPQQVHEILVKLLDAIDLVHRHDLLHRDISPDNILLDKWGNPALIDFGAAREDASEKVNQVSKMLVVKDGYSPHEFYIKGGAQGPSSDLYALAATMYHLISRQPPADSQTRVSALTAQQDDPCLPLNGRFPQYGAAFLSAVDKAMSLAPKDRFQSAKAWRAMIEEETKAVRVVPMPKNGKVSKTLSELIEETNKQVLAAPVEIKKAVRPAEPVNNTSVFRPEWVEEFNRETLEEAERRRAEERAAREAARQAMLERQRQASEAEAAAREAERQLQEKEKSRGLLDWVRSKPL
jgi:serine/threonine protein kinase